MASSDEEGEILPDSVTNYHFVNSDNSIISFSDLPLYSTDHDVIGVETSVAFLIGSTDGGLQSVYKEVIGWKFELSFALPEFYVLSKARKWIKLEKPSKSYENIVKTILIVVQFLHSAKRNAEASKNELLNDVIKTLSWYDVVEPLETHLKAHLLIIQSAVIRDKDLAKSKYIAMFLKEIENPGRRENFQEKKLHVSLAPFLHGARYTSFGRHFSKVEKLKEIVDRLHWYVKDGDTVVDFCCGSNDFSCLMKEKLDSMGKTCEFKNYDLITPKNTFSFEKRDWLSVPLEALPDGSRLIMGLNPPFGVQASLANKFIDHALRFKPKLLILIVPSETGRLDQKRSLYDLIWEEEDILSGKSFYLPRSVDNKNQPLDDWKVNPPPLSLWSRPDWTTKHIAVAERFGHVEPGKNKPLKRAEMVVSNYLIEEKFQLFEVKK